MSTCRHSPTSSRATFFDTPLKKSYEDATGFLQKDRLISILVTITTTFIMERFLFAILVVFATTLPSISSLSTTSAASQTSRRDILARTASFAIASQVLTLGSQVSNAVDLSTYQDGPQGLKYTVLNDGAGSKPERGQKIQTSYTLWINGFPEDPGSKQIDSSKKAIIGDQPFKVRAGVSQVIKGWDLTLIDMKEGETRRLVVPPELGYGDKGVGPIPGKATLYFEMQLTKVEALEELTPEAKKWLDEHPL